MLARFKRFARLPVAPFAELRRSHKFISTRSSNACQTLHHPSGSGVAILFCTPLNSFKSHIPVRYFAKVVKKKPPVVKKPPPRPDDWVDTDDEKGKSNSRMREADPDERRFTIDDIPPMPDPPKTWEERLGRAKESNWVIYTERSTPCDHTEQDDGKYYEISQQIADKIPQDMRKPLLREFEETSGRFMMVRAAARELVHDMQLMTGQIPNDVIADESIARRIYAITGDRGCGKSCALHYALQHAFHSNWLVLALNAFSVLDDCPGFITPSIVKPDLYDQNLLSSKLLQNWMDGQGHLVSQIKVKRAESVAFAASPSQNEAYAGSPTAPSNLVEFVTECKNRKLSMATAMYHFLEEIKAADEVFVVVAIDNINCWDQNSFFHNPASLFKKLTARQLSLVDHFLSFEQIAPKNGFSIFAMSNLYSKKNLPPHLTKAKLYKVPHYSMDEMKHAMQHYRVSALVAKETYDTPFYGRIYALTGATPSDVFDIALMV